MPDAVVDFRNAVKPFIEDWNSIDLRVIAIRTKDGRWFFNSIYAVLDSAPPSLPCLQDLPNSGNLFVTHERWERSLLDELLDSISSGVLTIGNRDIQIKRLNGQKWDPIPPTFRFMKRSWTREKLKIDFATYQVQIWDSLSNVTNREMIDSINTSLRCSDPPWDNLADIRENFIGLTKHYASQEGSGDVYVIAPLGVRIADSSTLEGQRLTAIIERDSGTKTGDIAFSVIANTSGNNIMRLRKPFKGSVHNQGETISTTIDLEKQPSKAKLIVNYKEMDVDEREFFGKASSSGNARAVVLESMIGGFDELQKVLESAKGQNWEGGMALLFHLLGFSTAHYGILPQEIPDILAFPDSGNWILIIECTGASPDSRNKLSKLASRKNLILERLKGFDVYPVLVTKLNRSTITSTDSEIAANERIAIVTPDDIPDLFRLSIEGATPIKIRNYLETKIPYKGTFTRF